MSSDRPMSGTAELAAMIDALVNAWALDVDADDEVYWDALRAAAQSRLDARATLDAALVALVERAEGGARDTARIDKLAQFDEVEVLRIDEYPQSWSRGALVAPELRLRTFIDRIRPPAASRPLPTGERRG